MLAPLEKEVEDLIFTEAEVVDLWPEDRDPAEHARRSLYLFRKRNVRYPLFDAFDAPDTQNACPRRADQHPRPPGPDALEQRLRRGQGQGPGRPDLRGRRRRRSTIGFAGPTSSCWPASRSRSRSSVPGRS